MREMKDSGIAWIGEIPSEWEIGRIKTIFSERTELSQEGTEELLSVSEYYGVAPRASKVEDGEYVSRSESLEGYKKCYKGDFVSNIMLAWKGSFGVTEYDGIVSPAYCVYKPSKKIYSKFFHYLFRTSLYTSRFRLFSKGIIDSRLRLYSPYFYDIEAILPPLSEQHLISSYLDAKCSEIDSALSLQEQMISELRAYKQSLITEVVTHGLNPNAKMKNSGVEWIGEVPEGWEVRRLKNIGAAKNGLTYSPADLASENDGTLVLRSSNIKEGKLVFNDNVYVNTDIPSSLMVKKGDVIICSRNGSAALVGKCAIIEEDINATYGAFMMRFQSVYYYKYIYYLLSSAITQYKPLFATTTINQLTVGMFGNMKMSFTENASEQRSIATFLDEKCAEIDALIVLREKKMEALKEYKKSLIYECVTGKKEIV